MRASTARPTTICWRLSLLSSLLRTNAGNKSIRRGSPPTEGRSDHVSDDIDQLQFRGLRSRPPLRLSAARAALPCVPVTKQFELLVEAGFFDENIEFGAGKALTERFGAVGDSPGR